MTSTLSFSEILATAAWQLLSFALLVMLYRVYLLIKKQQYDRTHIIHLVVLLPLSVGVGNLLKSML